MTVYDASGSVVSRSLNVGKKINEPVFRLLDGTVSFYRVYYVVFPADIRASLHCHSTVYQVGAGIPINAAVRNAETSNEVLQRTRAFAVEQTT